MLSMEGKKNPAEQNHPGHSGPIGKTIRGRLQVQGAGGGPEESQSRGSQVEKQVRTAPRFSGAAG